MPISNSLLQQEVGKEMRYVRLKRQMNLQHIADKRIANIGTISRYERGLLPLPIHVFVEWCNVLHVLPSEILQNAIKNTNIKNYITNKQHNNETIKANHQEKW